MSSYSSKRRDAAIADDFLGTHLECRFCRGMTPREDLTRYGARCAPCYAKWQAEANPRWLPDRKLTAEELAKLRARIRTGLQRLVAQPADPKAWAHRLRERELSGKPMTRLQREAWREVLQPIGVESAP